MIFHYLQKKCLGFILSLLIRGKTFPHRLFSVVVQSISSYGSSTGSTTETIYDGEGETYVRAHASLGLIHS